MILVRISFGAVAIKKFIYFAADVSSDFGAAVVMKVLVTGGSGFLGTHLKRSLNADDFSRRSGCDILNLQDAKRVADYDVVVHLAAKLDKSPGSAEQVFLSHQPRMFTGDLRTISRKYPKPATHCTLVKPPLNGRS
jgi:hypothetical protein